MADPRAAVVVPTHSHGPLLVPAVRSALAQTVTALEVHIIGDGVDEATRAAGRRLADADARVRFHDLPKGPRHGELHRHRLLTEVIAAPVIAYLSDDDLWLPDHLERLAGLLEDADFAHALSTWILPDGTAQATFLDLETPYHRHAVIAREKTPSLTVAAHTLAAYRRLPAGWRTTPEGVHTDHWMWRQWLEQDWVRARSGRVPTVVHLPSPPRRDWPIERRLAELEGYERAIADPAWRLRHTQDVLALAIEEDAWYAGQADHLQQWGDGLKAWGDTLSGEAAALWDRVVRLEDEVAQLRNRA